MSQIAVCDPLKNYLVRGDDKNEFVLRIRNNEGLCWEVVLFLPYTGKYKSVRITSINDTEKIFEEIFEQAKRMYMELKV